jgi:MFS family permease
MTRFGDSPTDPAASASVASASSAWTPFRRRAFRWLWLGVLASSVGTWMQIIGAQWLLVDEPNAAVLVALVQVASTLPVMLLALPGGVLADSFDRRSLLLTVQAYLLVIGVLLVSLTAAGHMPPALLLVFTFAFGAGVAVQYPGWQASISELVPRTQLPAAARLDMVSVNLARSVGPALAGLVIAHLGVPFVFVLNVASVFFFALVLVFWRRPQAEAGSRERFLPALRAGGRYVWHEPVVRRILLRAAIFIAPAMALWALLPVIANQRLGLGADGFGALFGALGVGAVVGALVLGWARTRVGVNGILGAAGIAYAAVLVLIVLVPTFPAALVTLVFAGLAWMSVISTLNAELQLFMPGWVRARGLGVYLVVMTGSQALGALVWGLVADRFGVAAALVAAAVVVVSGVVAGLVWPLPDMGPLDRQPAVFWPEARLGFDPEPEDGPVLVTVEYTVTSDREAAFQDVMSHLRRSRLRTGATRWELYRDGERPDRFVELFSVPSWGEHLRQHGGRLTAEDKELEEAAHALSDPSPRGQHLFPP